MDDRRAGGGAAVCCACWRAAPAFVGGRCALEIANGNLARPNFLLVRSRFPRGRRRANPSCVAEGDLTCSGNPASEGIRSRVDRGALSGPRWCGWRGSQGGKSWWVAPLVRAARWRGRMLK